MGGIAPIDEVPRSASVVTLVRAKTSLVSGWEFNRCVSEHPAIAVELIRSLVQRVRALTENVKNPALLLVYDRVAGLF